MLIAVQQRFVGMLDRLGTIQRRSVIVSPAAYNWPIS
jgi:hypothetical protein